MSKKKHIITTSRGVKIECQGIAAALETQESNIRESINWPDKPGHTITDVAGSTMETPLSQAYIDSGHATNEEKDAWAEYLVKLAEAEAEFKVKLDRPRMLLIAYKGIRVVDGDLEKKWAEEHPLMGMTLPDSAPERALHFLMTEIMGDLGDDLAAIMVGIYAASGADPELLGQAEATFRAEMGATRRATAIGAQGSTATVESEEGAGVAS
jgi:hypothetical protein